MSQYFYLVASLPHLTFDMEAPLSAERFLEACASWLPESELTELEATKLNMRAEELTGNPLQREWFIREQGLRNALVELRAGRLGWDAMRYRREASPGWMPTPLPERAAVEGAARNATEERSPKSAEMILEQFRFRILDDLEVGHYFDLERLMVYYLKLQILWRKDLFDRETGEEVFRRTYDTITEPLNAYRYEGHHE